MEKTVLSAGAEYSTSHTDNDYTGNVNTDAVLNSQSLYFFAQIQGKLGPLKYMLGAGASHKKTCQDEAGFSKWMFRPQLTLQISPLKNTSLRFTSRMSEHTPSLSQLSDVRQQSDELTANCGNPYLKPYRQYANNLTVNWNTPPAFPCNIPEW